MAQGGQKSQFTARSMVGRAVGGCEGVCVRVHTVLVAAWRAVMWSAPGQHSSLCLQWVPLGAVGFSSENPSVLSGLFPLGFDLG